MSRVTSSQGSRTGAAALRILRALAVLAFGAMLGIGVWVLWPGPLVPLQDAAVAGVPRDSYTVAHHEDAGGYLEIAPASGGAGTLFVLYPGGLVRPQAYVWLGVALAGSGVRTVIPVMPLDLAVLAPNRAAALIDTHADATTIVIGGHSLGGAMAARFAARSPERVDALVLMGAFGAEGDDLSGADLEGLVLAAEHDGLATLEEVRTGLRRMPAGTSLTVVHGAVHAFFGRYGSQRGDGAPTVERNAAEAEIVARIGSFLADVAAGAQPRRPSRVRRDQAATGPRS